MDIDTLYAAVGRGDRDAEDLLFKCLAARFRMFVRRRFWGQSDWEDIVQEALTTISTEYKTIEIKSSFAAWAYQVLRNKVLQYSQTKRRQSARTVPFAEIAHNFVTTGITDIRRRLLACLREVGCSNLRYARILNFHFLGYSTVEICDKMQLRRENYYSILSRARSMLEACLNQGGKRR